MILAASLARAVGLGIAAPAVCAVAGILYFAGRSHRGPESEVHALVRLAHRIAVLAAVGAAVEAAAVARTLDAGWFDALTDRAPGALLRLLGAALVVAGLFELPETRAGGAADQLRWSPAGAGVLAVAGAVIGLLSFAFDGYTVTRGPRVVHALASVVHVAAVSVWAGGVIALLAVWLFRRGSPARPLAPLVRGWLTTAVVAGAAAAAVGVLLTALIVDAAGDLTASTWGRVLIAKLAVAAVAAGITWAVRSGTGPRLGPLLGTAAIALGAVLVLTTVLVRAAA